MKEKIIVLLVALLSTMTAGAQTYQGTVCDSATNKPLEYATIILLKKGDIAATAHTEADGSFKLKAAKGAEAIKVSLVGYNSRSIALTDQQYNMGNISLSSVELENVTVNGSTTKYEVDKDTYIITDSIRKGMINTADMLGQLPGITYNWYDKSLTVYGQKNILLVANGVEMSPNHIKEINPKRVKSVEVIHNPGGRYISDNYAALINVVLYDDYVGWDATLNNKLQLNAGNLNNWKWLVSETPNADYTYTRNNISINANYTYNTSRSAIKFEEWDKIVNVMETTIEPINDDDNMRVSRDTHKMSAGMDYQLNKQHTLSFQTEYSFSDSHANSRNMATNLSNSNDCTIVEQNINSNNSSNDFVAALFYRGKIGERWDLYSDINYNHYNARNYGKNEQKDWFSNEYVQRGTKDYLRFNADATYTFDRQTTMKFGYASTWKDYKSHEELKNSWNEASTNYRHRIFAYYTHKFNDKLSTSVGTSAEWLRFTNSTAASNHFAILPDIRINYNASRKMNAQLMYTSSAAYPTLEQTAISYRLDTLSAIESNPTLHQAMTHQFSLRVRLWNSLTITPSYKFNDNCIESYSLLTEGNIITSTYVNADYKSWAVNVNYEKMFNRTLLFSANMNFDRSTIKFGNYHNTCNNLKGSAMLMYMNPKNGYRYLLQYTHYTNTTPMIQGHSIGGDNYWMMAIMKTAMKGRLSFMLAYMPPFDLGIDKCTKKVIDTDFYHKRSSEHTFDILKNRVIFTARLNMSHGQRTKKHTNITTTDQE